MKDRYVVITTDSTRRGVFAGKLVSHETDVVVLEEAQMCVYWSIATHSVLGLAAHGPAEGSRIGPPTPRLEVDRVTAVIDMTDKAVEAWKTEPWS